MSFRQPGDVELDAVVGAVQVGCALDRLESGVVAVERKRDVVRARDRRECLQVLFCERGSSGGDDVGEVRLVGGDGVWLPLDHYGLAGVGDWLVGELEAVEQGPFLV